MACAKWVFVVLDNRDYYGPHFDEVFVDLDKMRDHVAFKYKHKNDYEVRVYSVSPGKEPTLTYSGEGVIR